MRPAEPLRQRVERIAGGLLDRYRSARLTVGALRAPPGPDDGAATTFYRAVDRNFVSRLAVEVAATLGLVDRILGGVTAVDELAAACEVDPGAFRRLLRVLDARGLVKLHGDEMVAVTEAGRFLADSHPLSWRSRLDLDGMGRRMDEAVFFGLMTSIRTGLASYGDVHGLPFWNDIEQRGAARSFQDHMRARVADIAADVASLPEIAGAAKVLDVCGGDGMLLESLLGAHPQLHGSLLELPESAALARDRFERSGLGPRVTVLAGDVFAAAPPPHDVCLLSWVLHDWPDEQAVEILKTCGAAAPNGRTVVIERSLDGSLDVMESDLRMLVFFGGRERTRPEWLRIFAEAGLSLSGETAVGTGGFVAYCLQRPPSGEDVAGREAGPRR